MISPKLQDILNKLEDKVNSSDMFKENMNNDDLLGPLLPENMSIPNVRPNFLFGKNNFTQPMSTGNEFVSAEIRKNAEPTLPPPVLPFAQSVEPPPATSTPKVTTEQPVSFGSKIKSFMKSVTPIVKANASEPDFNDTSFQKEIDDAINRRDTMNSQAGALKGFADIAAGLGGLYSGVQMPIKADVGSVLENTASQQVGDVKERIGERRRDPKSEESKAARNRIEAMFPDLKVPPDLSAEKADDFMKLYGIKYDREERMKLAQAKVEEARSIRELKKDQKLSDLDYKLSNKLTSGVYGKAYEQMNTSKLVADNLLNYLGEGASGVGDALFQLQGIKTYQLDSSVVRESDTKIYQEALGTIQALKIKLSHLNKGDTLDADSRNQMYDAVKKIRDLQVKAYWNMTSPIRNQALSNGRDLNNIYDPEVVELGASFDAEKSQSKQKESNQNPMSRTLASGVRSENARKDW